MAKGAGEREREKEKEGMWCIYACAQYAPVRRRGD